MARFRIEKRPIDPHTMVAGLDLSSTKLAAYWIGLDGWGQGWKAWEFSDGFIGADGIEVTLYIMRRWARTFDCPLICYVEQPVVAGARNIQTTIKQSLVNGAAQAGLMEGGAQVVPVVINVWKLSFTGYGNASKEDVRAKVKKKWPGSERSLVSPNGRPDQDLNDAFGICHHGIGYLAKTTYMDTSSSVRRPSS